MDVPVPGYEFINFDGCEINYLKINMLRGYLLYVA